MSQEHQTQRITPYLTVSNGAAALEYYQSCMGAKILERKENEDGQMIHASFELPNGAQIMLCDMGHEKRTLREGQLPSVSLSLTFATHKDGTSFWDTFKSKNNENDFKISMEFAPQFWGSNFGQFTDKFGHIWQVSSPLEKDAKVPENPFKFKQNIKDNLKEKEKEKVQITGKKRNTMDDNENDSKEDEPPKKKQKLESNSNSNENATNTKSDSNEKTGFKEIQKNVGAKYGLFRKFTVGEGGEVKCFGEAFKSGVNSVWKIIDSNKDTLKSKMTDVIAISPDDPNIIKPARYVPGFLFDINKISKDELKKYETDTVKVAEVPACDWYVYLHCGSYKNIANSWENAKNDLKERKLDFAGKDYACFEQYLNDPSQTAVEDLRTLICIGVKSK